MKFGDVKLEEDGVYVSFVHEEARGEESRDQCLVPYDRANPHICFASPISRYIDQVKASLPHLRAEDPLFHRALKCGFGEKGQIMGVNMLGKIGKEVARELGLEKPESYTGYCFRRSSATEAANKGATSIDMKRLVSDKEEATQPIPNISGPPEVTAEDIQSKISSAFKNEELSPKQLLEIMQNMLIFQKNKIDKKQKEVEATKDQNIESSFIEDKDIESNENKGEGSNSNEEEDVERDPNEENDISGEEEEDDLDSLVQLEINQVENEEENNEDTLDGRNLDEEELQDLISKDGSSTKDDVDKYNEPVSIPDPQLLEENLSEVDNDDLGDLVQLELADSNDNKGEGSNSNEEEDVESDPKGGNDNANVPSNVIAINPFSGAFISRRIKRKGYLKDWVKNSTGLLQQTAKVYEKTWNDFISFLKLTASDEPSMENYVKYFRFLSEVKKQRATTLWSRSSRLKNIHIRKFSPKNVHDIFPTIWEMIKEYEKSDTKSEFRVFSKEQVHRTLQLNDPSPGWILKKAAISIVVCGGLNLGEMRRFKLSHLQVEKQGVRIRYPENPGKDDKFLVPFSKSEPCLASAVITYLDSLRKCLPDIGVDAALFHRVVKNGYNQEPYGQNKFTKIGQEVASRLGLDSPELYNSNCFKLYSKIEDGDGYPLDTGRKRTLSDPETVWGKIFQGTNNAGKKRPRLSTSSASGSQ